MAKIDIAKLKEVVGSGYPSPFNKPCLKRGRKRLGNAAKLTQFGVNLLRLEPGVWSSQRHWHTKEDEFIFVVKGEVVLITDDSKRTLPLGVQKFMGDQFSDIGMVATGAMISIIPVVIFYALFSEKIIKGMTAGAIK